MAHRSFIGIDRTAVCAAAVVIQPGEPLHLLERHLLSGKRRDVRFRRLGTRVIRPASRIVLVGKVGEGMAELMHQVLPGVKLRGAD